jgi:hypothetical protein
MSALGPELHAALDQLLQGLQSPDNVLRTQAEAHLNDEWATSRPEVLLMGLSEQIEGAQVEAVCRPRRLIPWFPLCVQATLTRQQTRSFAAVLFRRISNRTRKDPSSTEASAVTKELFMTLTPPQRGAIRGKLLQALSSESSSAVRNKTADAVAEIARQYTDDGKV